MRLAALLALLAPLAACGGGLGTAQYSDGQFLEDTSDPGDAAVADEVRSLPFKHIEWEYKLNRRDAARLTMAGDQLFVETSDHSVVAMDRFNGRTQWIFRIDTRTPLDWAPVVAAGVPEEIRQLETELITVNRQIEDQLKTLGVGKETQALQKKRGEIKERLRVAAFGDNCYFVSRQVLYCLSRISGGLNWTHRLNFVPSARPFAVRNYVFIPGADLARVWVLDVDRKGQEISSYKASIQQRENQIMNAPVFSDPSLFFVSHDGAVYCYRVSDSGLTWTYQTERSLRADPVVFVHREPDASAPAGAPKGAPAMGAPSMGAPAMGAPAMGAPAMGAPAMGAPAMGAPAMGAPAMGAPAMGGPGTDDGKGVKKRATATTRYLFVGGTDNAFYALDADGGNLIWKYECGGEIRTPAVAKDQTVYVRTVEGALHAFEVAPMHRDSKGAVIGPKRNGSLRWKIPMAERFLSKGAQTVYIMGPNREIWSVKEMSGEVVGRYPTRHLQHILTNAVDDLIYVANGAGYIYCLRESRRNF
jgi:outer membrane protein assembly factor BamB